MTKKTTTNLYATLGLFVAVFSLLAYSFSSAEWKSAPATAPQENTDAPVNVSDQTQVKTGSFGAYILASATTTGAGVWAKEYCDEYGENCYPSDGPLAQCNLEYRFYVASTDGPWQSVSLDGTTNEGRKSGISRDSWSSGECKGGTYASCGIQMRMVCSDVDTWTLDTIGSIYSLLQANMAGSLPERVYNNAGERAQLCELLHHGSRPASWTTGYYGQPYNNTVGKYVGGNWRINSPATYDNTFLTSLVCTTNSSKVATSYYDWQVSVPTLTASNPTRTVVCKDNAGNTATDNNCSAQKPLTQWVQWVDNTPPTNDR